MIAIHLDNGSGSATVCGRRLDAPIVTGIFWNGEHKIVVTRDDSRVSCAKCKADGANHA